MAETNMNKLISLQNLSDYDTLIKNYVDTADAKAIKTVLWDATAEQIKFYKKENASLADTADYSVSVASSDVATLKTQMTEVQGTLTGYSSTSTVKSAVDAVAQSVEDLADGAVAKNTSDIAAINNSETGILKQAKDYTDALANGAVATNTADIAAINNTETGILAQAEAKITALDNSLAAVAKSGNASDVAIADAAGKYTAETVEGALLEVKNLADTTAAAVAALDIDGDIEAAINKLDKEDTAVAGQFVTAVSEEDGIITVSRAALSADDIPTLTLDKITDAGTAAAADVATTAIAEESTDASLVTAAQVAKFVKDEVADLEGATHFIGVKDALPESANAGDICIVGVKEYIYDETRGWVELGDETIYVTKTTTIAGVDLENNITKEEMLTALNVADGAQVNVIESVKVNGAALAITDKAVDVTVATGATDGTVAVNGIDVAVAGLGSAAYTDADAYEAAGSIATEIAKLDATVSTVSESDPTPVIAVTVVEEDGKLTSVTASALTADNADITALFSK